MENIKTPLRCAVSSPPTAPHPPSHSSFTFCLNLEAHAAAGSHLAVETGEAALARAQAHHAVRLQRPAGPARRLSGGRKGTALSRVPQWLRNIPARPSCSDAVCKALTTPRRAGGGRLRGLRPSAAGRSVPPSPVSPWSWGRGLSPGRMLHPPTLTQPPAGGKRGSLASLASPFH